MKLVDIEKELENLGCHSFLWDGLGEVSFYLGFGGGFLSGEVQEREELYLITVSVEFCAWVSREEKLLELDVQKTDIDRVFKRIEHIICYVKERFNKEKNTLDALPYDVEDVNEVKVDVVSKLFDTFSTIGIVFDCNEGYLDRLGMVNLYVTIESTSNASAVVKIFYAGALKYKRYIDATNVDVEIKNIEKCVETFKENFIDSQELLKELRNF